MKYCTKCGKELNDGDLFCGNCGAKVNEITRSSSSDDYYSNNYNTNRVSNILHPTSKIAFILSIIGIVLFIGEMLLIGFHDTDISATLFVLGFMLLIFVTGGALGTAIPGFIINKKRDVKKGIVIAAFVLAIILATCMIFLYAAISALSE